MRPDQTESRAWKKMASLLEHLYEGDKPLITFGTLSQSPAQFLALWALRESIAEAAGKAGKVYKYDVSVPPTEFVNVTNKVRERVKGNVKEVLGYGHVGDGELALGSSFNGGSGWKGI